MIVESMNAQCRVSQLKLLNCKGVVRGFTLHAISAPFLVYNGKLYNNSFISQHLFKMFQKCRFFLSFSQIKSNQI